MASDNQSFPKVPESFWWSLRKRFHKTIPKEVNEQYLVTALGLGQSAAKTYISPLKKLGIIDEDGKTTERANKWRGEQADYAEACREMLRDIYPDNLNDAIHDPRDEKDKVIRWFMSTLRIGDKAAQQMAIPYVLICEADLSKEPENNGSSKSEPKPKSKKKETPVALSVREEKPAKVTVVEPEQKEIKSSRFQPKIHIDVQIHISPESTADQIDQIFASMAKHLTNIKE
jgi:hypothetical protein